MKKNGSDKLAVFLMVFSIVLLIAIIVLTVVIFLREHKNEAADQKALSTSVSAGPGSSQVVPDWKKDEEELDRMVEEMETATWQLNTETGTEGVEEDSETEENEKDEG